jgi:hypothetical protein
LSLPHCSLCARVSWWIVFACACHTTQISRILYAAAKLSPPLSVQSLSPTLAFGLFPSVITLHFLTLKNLEAISNRQDCLMGNCMNRQSSSVVRCLCVRMYMRLCVAVNCIGDWCKARFPLLAWHFSRLPN